MPTVQSKAPSISAAASNSDDARAIAEGRTLAADVDLPGARRADIRAGAGLVLAGLVAEGQTTVYGVSHIDMPTTPNRIWSVISERSATSASRGAAGSSV